MTDVVRLNLIGRGGVSEMEGEDVRGCEEWTLVKVKVAVNWRDNFRQSTRV